MLAWITFIPVATAIAVALLFVAPILIHQPQTADASLFLSYLRVFCRPEPLEQARYLFAIGIPFVTILAFCAWARASRGRTRKLSDAAWARGGVLSVQIFLFLLFIVTWIFQNIRLHAFFGAWDLAGGILAALLLGGAWRQKPLRKLGKKVWLAPLLALALTLVWLLPTLATDGRLSATTPTFQFHLPFTTAEFTSVLNGRTPLVDFFPQYTNILPILLKPFFLIVDFSLGSFTFAMAALNLLGLFLIYLTLKRVTQSAWIALLLYIPVLGISFYPMEITETGIGDSFTYYALGPIRYLGPWIVTYLLARVLSRSFGLRAFFFIAGLVVVNNLDFGVPAFLAALVSLLILELGESRRRVAHILGAAALGLFSAVALFVLFIRLTSGRMPQLEKLFLFQKIFAVHGFNMLPMFGWGWEWMMGATWMIAIFVGVYGAWVARRLPGTQLCNGLLIFSGINGLGAFSYYIGRSAWSVMCSSFGNWGFTLVLLAYVQYQHWRESGKGALKFQKIPAAITAILLMLCLSTWRYALTPLTHARQAKASTPRFDPKLPEKLRTRTTPGEPVGLLFPYGYEIALAAGLDNRFPFADQNSVMILPQIDFALEQLKNAGVREIFGDPHPEIEERMKSAGYTRVVDSELSVGMWTR